MAGNRLAGLSGFLLLGVLTTWVLYGLFGHQLIETLYASKWLPGNIMAERTAVPLAAYYEKADAAVLLWLLRFLAVFPLLVILVRRPRPAVSFFLLTLAVYASSTSAVGAFGHAGQSDQLHFSYLAEAFLKGQLNIWLTQDEARVLSEVVVYAGKCYILFPPLPAVLLMPFVLIFGRTFPTILLSMAFAAGSVTLMYTLLRRTGFSEKVSAWVTVLFGFGTTFWYTSVNGGVWWLAQVIGVFFLLVALVEVYGKKRPLVIGAMIGAATLSRLPLVLSTPFLLYLLLQDKQDRIRKASLMLFGVGVFCGLNMLYNWFRFGSIANVAYYMIPEVYYAPWFKNGIFDLHYIPRNIYAIFFQPPVLIESFPYIVPTAFGLALFFTTPALLLAFRAPGDQRTWLLVGAVLLVALPTLSHGFIGSGQFGYRYSLDYTPFLMLLTARGLGTNISGKVASLIVLSCVISLWGLRYNSWIEPKWVFDIEAYYKNVHPDEAKINSACIPTETH